jgi:lipopolysaccharide/colanic/teichoic acid biosynthesis glycosyltransferase
LPLFAANPICRQNTQRCEKLFEAYVAKRENSLGNHSNDSAEGSRQKTRKLESLLQRLCQQSAGAVSLILLSVLYILLLVIATCIIASISNMMVQDVR